MTKILIVEDDLMAANTLASGLGAAGYECAIQSQGAEALETARAEAPDLMVLDIMMPDVSGFEVCRSVRRDKDLFALPIVIVSAMSNSEEIEHGLSQGADAYVSKPVNISDLIRRIEAVLARHAKISQSESGDSLEDSEATRWEIQRRIGQEERFALVYAEVMRLREFTKSVEGDGRERALRHFVRVLRGTANDMDIARFFMGHMGGGHFVCITEVSKVREFCATSRSAWRGHLANLYAAVQLSNVFEAANEKGETEQTLLDVLFCVTMREPKESINAQQMLEIVSRIRNTSAKDNVGGTHLDRRCGHLLW